jgi:hypothetical protein
VQLSTIANGAALTTCARGIAGGHALLRPANARNDTRMDRQHPGVGRQMRTVLELFKLRKGTHSAECVLVTHPIGGRSASLGAGGGNRTHTGGDPHGILSPARLPVSPLRHRRTTFQYTVIRARGGPRGPRPCTDSYLHLRHLDAAGLERRRRMVQTSAAGDHVRPTHPRRG